MALHAQNRGSQWSIDSGFSKHMTRDQNKFLSLNKEKGGNVTFGSNVTTNIAGKGTISLGNERTIENVLFVEDLKHNFINVSQMCDQGHFPTFNSQECEIRKERSSRLVATQLELQTMYTF